MVVWIIVCIRIGSVLEIVYRVIDREDNRNRIDRD